MKNLNFVKLSGAGNDFIVIDLRSVKRKLTKLLRKKIVRKVCDRNFGVGADGLIFLEKSKSKQNNFKWDFYNKDGSDAEMCLNASRCVVRYELDIAQKRGLIQFESDVGIVRGKKKGSNIQVELPVRKQQVKPLRVLTKNKKVTRGYYVNSGVPHFVVFQKLKEVYKMKEISSELRFHKEFKKPGSNITYWEKKGSQINAVTFERGVEDYTLACGTGAVAVGMVFDSIFSKNPVTIQMPGGKIKVEVQRDFTKIEGPAEIICKGVLCLKV